MPRRMSSGPISTELNAGTTRLATTPIATKTSGDATPRRGPTSVAPAITTSATTITINNSVMCLTLQQNLSRSSQRSNGGGRVQN